MSAPASFRIDYQRHGDLLRAHGTGVKGSLETALAFWTLLAEEVRRDPPRKLMVVDDMEGPSLTPAQMLQFVQALVGLGFEGVRLAYVEAHPQQIPDVEHSEIFARERGFDVRVFGSEPEARLWLRHGMS
ncbi:hypothetical protein [Thermomonas sp.]